MLSLFLVFSVLLALLSPSMAQDVGQDLIRWVVTFKDGVFPEQVDSLLAIAGIEIPDIPLTIPELFMRVFMMDARVAKLVAKLPAVKYIEQDEIVELIVPVARRAANLTSPVQATRQSTESIPYGIDLVQALGVDDSNVGNRMVCIIDSGYDLGHVDLPGASLVTGSDDLGVQPWFEDDNSHGTHVAGTIAALGNNELGVIGVNRNGLLPIHIVRIFDETGQTYASDAVADVQACINAGANVVSMSFGRVDDGSLPLLGPTEYERQAFDKFYSEGTLLIAAAGNEGNNYYNWPASYESVMSVAAVDENKQVASFSTRNDAVDIAAPGVGVLSTVPGDGYAIYDGTSMACPHVSGVAALVWSNFPQKSAQEVWYALTQSAEDLGPAGRDDSYGFGLVQATAALDFLASGDSVVEPPPSSPADPTPSPVPVDCVDDGTWSDAFGDACDWFDSSFLCQAFGALSTNGDLTAFDACCICGGGISLAEGEGDSPPSTASPPADTPTSAALKFSSVLPPFLALFSFVAVFMLC